MTRTGRFVERFPEKSSIKWLDHEQRKKHRTTIKVMLDLVTTLDKPNGKLTEGQTAFLQTLTQSEAIDTQVNAAWDIYDKTAKNYYGILAAMGPHDLTAYHEVLNPSEPPARHQIWLCDHLMAVAEGEIALLGISLPAGAAKTSYASRSFGQWWMGRRPEDQVVGLSHSDPFVLNQISRVNRNVMESEEYRQVFPDIFIDPEVRGVHFWKLLGHKGSFTPRGAKAGISGTRANLVIADDLYRKAADALSPIISEQIWTWFAGDVLPRCLPNCPIVMPNTRWVSHDVLGRIDELNKKDPNALPQPVILLNLPAQAEENDPVGRAEGEWLWCKDQQDDGFYPARHYETLRATMPPSLWSAVYLGKPLDQQGNFVSEDDFATYKKPPMNRPGHAIEWVKTIMTVDTAAKGQERSDRTAIQIYREGVDGFYYMVWAYAGKPRYDELIGIMSKMMRTWTVNFCIVEDAGMGIQLLENHAHAMPAPLVKYTPRGKGSKEFRFDNACPYIRTGRILFPERASWLTDFINELIAFPDGKYRDQADAFAQFCDYVLRNNKQGGTKRLKHRSGVQRINRSGVVPRL